MGNGGGKLSDKDLAMLKSTEDATGCAAMSTAFQIRGEILSRRLVGKRCDFTHCVSSMDRKELMKEYKKFKKQFHSDGINREQFRQMAVTFLPEQQRTEEFIDRLFNAFDSDRSGSVDFKEFMLAMTMCSSDNPEDKLRFCFRSLDTDNNGALDRDEVLYAVELIFKHNPGIEKKVSEDVNTPQKVVDKIFEYVDTDKDGKLTAEELITMMHKDSKTFAYLGLNLIFLT